MRNDRLLGLLAKCLEMVNSDQDGEALAAARKANALREKMGIGWEEVLRGTPGPIRHDAPSPRLEAEVDYLRSRLNEVQNDLIQARKAAHSAEIETRALREALAEGNAAMERRERELRQRLIEVEGMLEVERERNQQATARLAVLQDIKGHADRRVAAAERVAAEATDQAKALEKSNESFLKRELGLRESMEKARRESITLLGERDRLERQVKSLQRRLGDRSSAGKGKVQDRSNGQNGGHHESGTDGALAVIGESATPAPHPGRGLVILNPQQVGRIMAPTPDKAANGSGSQSAEASEPRLSTGLLQRTQPFVFVENRGIVVEIKPLSRMFLYSSLKRARAAMDYARETGADYVVVSASGVTLNTLFSMEVERDAVDAVLDEIDRQGQLSWSDYQDLRERYDLKTIHTAAIVLQNDLFFSRLPWRLKRLPDGESFRPLKDAAAAIGTA